MPAKFKKRNKRKEKNCKGNQTINSPIFFFSIQNKPTHKKESVKSNKKETEKFKNQTINCRKAKKLQHNRIWSKTVWKAQKRNYPQTNQRREHKKPVPKQKKSKRSQRDNILLKCLLKNQLQIPAVHPRKVKTQKTNK